MRSFSHILLLTLTIIFPFYVNAQLISIKTVPLATGEQFLIFPSQRLGMANVSIAIDDPFLDPYINPAKGGIYPGSQLSISPVLYKISKNENSNKTLPLNILLNKNLWFSASSLSIQELNLSRTNDFESTLKKQALKNSYFFGSYGRRLGNDNTFLAGSIYWADLSGIDGVEYLYSGFTELTQSGKIIDLRLGFYKQLRKDYTLEAMLIHNRFDMSHEFSDSGWRNIIQKTEYDHTNTWGLHFGYVRPFNPNQWKVGCIFTANWKSHPKIPNYDLMRIPRDPGNTWAYNIGIGLAKLTEKFTFGFDIIYEPIWSNTWADAENTIETVSGKHILKGDKTVDNDFTFSNSIVRFGISSEDIVWGFQLGLQIHTISYDLKQMNYIQEFQRGLHENWREWTMSWGLFFKFQDFRLHYAGKIINGTGRPGVINDVIVDFRRASAFESSNFLIAPSSALTLDEAHIITHQIIISIPI